jgi:hypothetical protein
MKAMEGRLLYLTLRTTRATTESGPFKQFAWVARANIWDLNECASNRSHPCSAITTATSANVVLRFCSVFHLQIFAGSPAEPVWGKFNPNQMAHSSFSRTTNSLNSPQSQPPLPTNRLFRGLDLNNSKIVPVHRDVLEACGDRRAGGGKHRRHF